MGFSIDQLKLIPCDSIVLDPTRKGSRGEGGIAEVERAEAPVTETPGQLLSTAAIVIELAHFLENTPWRAGEELINDLVDIAEGFRTRLKRLNCAGLTALKERRV